MNPMNAVKHPSHSTEQASDSGRNRPARWAGIGSFLIRDGQGIGGHVNHACLELNIDGQHSPGKPKTADRHEHVRTGTHLDGLRVYQELMFGPVERGM